MFRHKRNIYLPMITWNMIDTTLHKIVGRYEYPVMPLNPRIGKMRAVIIASHIDKLIKKGVQKLWSRRNLIITMMVNKLPNVPIEIKEYSILEISTHRRLSNIKILYIKDYYLPVKLMNVKATPIKISLSLLKIVSNWCMVCCIIFQFQFLITTNQVKNDGKSLPDVLD